MATGNLGCLLVLLALLAAVASADDSGPFFIKASKSVPRIGRRGDFYIKAASKSVPRMGKKSEDGLLENSGATAPVENPKPVYLVRYARRGPAETPGAGSAVVPLNGKRDDPWGTEDLSWKDIDRLMEERPDLWRRMLEAPAPPATGDADADAPWRRHFEE
ncbi:hypothetical protein R5R35_007281 [Gryllus longicercus]|uniref:Uncharacterized protein n=1 Tax=Gryllus longicercus TaxID=2509291 RepID=A0AAN9VAH7_9ORTH